MHNQTLKKGILKSQMQVTKEQLQKSQTKDILKYEIEDREDPEKLAEVVILSTSGESRKRERGKKKNWFEQTNQIGILKTQMQATKEQLQKSQTKDVLKYEIEDRADPDELMNQNIYKTSLQVSKEQLQKSQIKDTMKHELDSRPDSKELEEARILKSPRQVTKEQLEKNQTKDTLKHELDVRAEPSELEDARILKSPRQVATEQLQRSLVKDQLKYEFEDRINPEELAEKESIYKTQMQVTKEQLQKSQIKDTMKHDLAARPSPSSLEEAGIIKSPRQLTKEQLQKSFVKDTLEREIEERPNLEDIAEKDNIYKTPLQVTKEQLEKSQIKDAMNHELTTRPSQSELEEAGITSLFSLFVATVYFLFYYSEHLKKKKKESSKQLQKSLVKDMLKQKISDRTDPSELPDAERIFKTPLQATKEQLDKSQNRDAIKRDLESRPPASELEEAGILKSPLQASKEQLQRSLIKDQLKLEMEERVNNTDDNNVSNETGNANTETRAALEQGLKSRHDINELEKGGIYKTTMQAAQEQLQKSQAKDQLRQEIENRSDTQELVSKGVMSDGSKVAPSLQMPAKGLEMNVKKDMVRRSLDAQPEIEQLEKQGIVYSTTLAPAIQGAAQEVEQQFRNRMGNFDEYVPPRPVAEHLGQEEYAKRTAAMMTRVTTRRSIDELEQRGVLPKNYLEQKQGKRKARQSLLLHLKQRPSLTEVQQRGFVNPVYLEYDDPEEAKKKLQSQTAKTEEHLNSFLAQRTKPEDVVYRGIMPDTDYFFEDKEQVEENKKRRLQNRKSNLEGHLGMKRQLKASPTEGDEEQSDEIFNQLKNITYKQKPQDEAPDTSTGTERRRRESLVVEEALRRRQSVHELEQRGVMKNQRISRRLQPAAKELEDRIENRMAKQQMEQLGLVRRSSLADSLQPRVEVLEPLIQKRQVDPPAESQLRQRNASFKNEVAPSITAAARAVSRKRMSFKLNQALTGRRDYQELVDEGIAFSERVAPTLHALAFTLEEKLRERVTEHYLKLKGVLPAKLDLDNALQNVAGILQPHLERRPSLLENEEFVRNVLGRVDIDNIRPVEEGQAAKSILEEKLDRERRPSYVELQKKNILKKSFNPKVDAMANASAKAELERHALEHNLKFQLASRRDPEDMVDSGYLYYPVNDERALSPGLHGVAHELQGNLEERPTEDYLVRKGIIQKDVQDWSLDQYAVRDNLTSRLSVRPPKSE
ncbi:hypothetical protein RFI_06361, partial [Reticulomyxa filosa]